MERPTCATCPYFDERAKVLIWRYPRDEVVPESGTCRKNANPQPYRLRDEWCGEHPFFGDFIDSLRAAAGPSPAGGDVPRA